MIDHFDSNMLLALVCDWRVLFALIVTLISGLLRGFTGFGSALFYIPAIASIYNPQVAAATLVMIDLAGSFRTTIKVELPHINLWKDWLVILVAIFVGAPIGTAALAHFDPNILRLCAAVIVVAMVVPLAKGCRYRGRPGPVLSVGVGFLSGLLGGAVAMEGPPAAIYWLAGSANSDRVVRANLMVFIAVIEAFVFIYYACSGLITVQTIVLFAILAPTFYGAFKVGGWWFRLTSSRTFRQVAYVAIAAAAVLSLPYGWLLSILGLV